MDQEPSENFQKNQNFSIEYACECICMGVTKDGKWENCVEVEICVDNRKGGIVRQIIVEISGGFEIWDIIFPIFVFFPTSS